MGRGEDRGGRGAAISGEFGGKNGRGNGYLTRKTNYASPSRGPKDETTRIKVLHAIRPATDMSKESQDRLRDTAL